MTSPKETERALLEVSDLAVEFPVRGRAEGIRAVDGVTLSVGANEIVGLVGESGCGKTTTGNAIVGLVPVAAGSICFDGKPIAFRSAGETRQFRRDVQMVFQDPMGSLNPRLPVGDAILETLFVHREHLGLASRNAQRIRAAELLDLVGLGAEFIPRYPHELSGGQRQRVGIARALAVRPRLLIADEPVSALDVSIQVQILNLIKDLSRELSFACLFIAHDLAVVRYMCDRTLVMYLGEVVEEARSQDLFTHPSHPYTRALLSAVPDVDKGLAARRGKGDRIILKGEVPSRLDPVPGCPFHPRCPEAVERCRTEKPTAVGLGNGHLSRCFFAGV
jgi:oligopeptide/dipeptide ABC transporter ATP-binding protein